MTKIFNRFNNQLICEDALLDIKQLAEKNKINLKDANLQDAKLRGANLQDADLRGADLRGADLQDADLRGAKIGNNIIKNYNSIEKVGDVGRQLRCFMFEIDNFYFMTGCFSGTEKELIAAVHKKYGKKCEYIDAIKFLKKLCKNEK